MWCHFDLKEQQLDNFQLNTTVGICIVVHMCVLSGILLTLSFAAERKFPKKDLQ